MQHCPWAANVSPAMAGRETENDMGRNIVRFTPADFHNRNHLSPAVHAMPGSLSAVLQRHEGPVIIRPGYISIMHRHFRSIPPAIGGIGISLPYSADTLRIDIALGILQTSPQLMPSTSTVRPKPGSFMRCPPF